MTLLLDLGQREPEQDGGGGKWEIGLQPAQLVMLYPSLGEEVTQKRRISDPVRLPLEPGYP